MRDSETVEVRRGESDHDSPPTDDSQRASGARVGQTVGRYTLCERLGQGGTGVVHAAWDPQLSRRVALKLLHDAGGGDVADSVARVRLLREAQALARVRHPNVIEVYDVGLYRGLSLSENDRSVRRSGVYMVMELVEGVDGAHWLRQRRDWQQVLAVFKQAARGLEAAHAAGLVHRDFKPANLLVAQDGRVRVLDFGLARALDGESSEGPPARGSIESRSGRNAEASGRLTETGAVMGTPRYMAPEQHYSEPTDARTDVYSFCVALWVALHGEGAFPGDNLVDVVHAKVEGRFRRPARRDVPSWLNALAIHGMQPQPGARPPSITVVLAALDRGGAGSRPLALPAALGGFAVVGIAAAVAPTPASVTAECDSPTEIVAEHWGPSARTAVTTSLTAEGTSFSRANATRVVDRIDTYTSRWSEAYAHVCASPQGAAARERALMCLSGRLDALDALVEVFGRGYDDVALRAVAMTQQLPALGACTDGDLQPGILATDHGREAAAIETGLARASMLLDAAAFEEAHALGEELVARADELGQPRMSARARLLLGNVAAEQTRHAEAFTLLEAAYLAALEHGLHEIAVSAAIRIVDVLAADERLEEAAMWGRRGEVQLSFLATGAEDLRARLRRNLANLEQQAGNFTAALAIMREVEAHFAAAAVRDPIEQGATQANLSTVLEHTGEFAEALSVAQASLSASERAYGEDHPSLWAPLDQIGTVLRRLGRHDEARPYYERSVAILEAAVDEDHADLASAYNQLAILHDETGDFAIAVEYYERVMKSFVARYGPTHGAVGAVHQNRAISLANLGDLEAARRDFAQAQRIWETVLGPDHPELAKNWHMRGVLALVEGDPVAALTTMERAVEILDAAVEPGNPMIVSPLLGRALAERAAGEGSRARASTERALQITTEALGNEHPYAGRALALLATLDADEGAMDRAETRAKEAARVLAASKTEGVWAAIGQLADARAVATDPQRRAQAQALFDACEATMEGATSFAPLTVAMVQDQRRLSLP